MPISFQSICRKKFINYLPDKFCCYLQYYGANGSFPDLKTPQTFNEKILLYKTQYRNHLMTKAADKFAVRSYISDLGLSSILNDLYGVYDSIDEIDFSSLPEEFIIKATHGWNMNVIRRNQESFDIDGAKNKFRKWLKVNWYWEGKQWAYKNIPPRIICEKYLVNKDYGELLDYKFYCYDGKAVVVFVCAGRYSEEGVKYDAFDMDWNMLPILKGKAAIRLNFPKPDNFEEMKEIACKLSVGFPFVRVDLYNVENKIIFGELTFYPDNGAIDFSPLAYNTFLGDFFILPSNKK